MNLNFEINIQKLKQKGMAILHEPPYQPKTIMKKQKKNLRNTPKTILRVSLKIFLYLFVFFFQKNWSGLPAFWPGYNLNESQCRDLHPMNGLSLTDSSIFYFWTFVIEVGYIFIRKLEPFVVYSLTNVWNVESSQAWKVCQYRSDTICIVYGFPVWSFDIRLSMEPLVTPILYSSPSVSRYTEPFIFQ